MENPAYTSGSKWLLSSMKNRAERIIFSSFIKAILTQRSSFYFLCVRISNDDLTRCDSSHIDAVSHLSSLRSSNPFHQAFYSFFRQRAETLEDRLSAARLLGPRPIGLRQRPSDVTSSVCAVEKLKGLCLRSGDSWRGQGRFGVRERRWCRENTKAALSERCEKRGDSEAGDLWPQVLQPQPKLLLWEDTALKLPMKWFDAH